MFSDNQKTYLALTGQVPTLAPMPERKGLPRMEQSDETAAQKLLDKKKMLPDKYKVDGNLCLIQKVKEDKTADIPLANFFAWINKVVIRKDGAEAQRLYELEGIILPNDKALPPILVPATDFDGMKWMSDWGPEPNVQPGPKVRDTVRHAIQSTASAAAKEQIFTHLGWVKLDGKWRYLHAGGAVGAVGVKVELDARLKGYKLPDSPGDFTEAMKASLRLLDVAPLRVTLPLWSLVFLSPLCEWLRWLNLEPKFLFWLHGYTGTRKTTLAKLFSCHFGELLEHPPASFKDTANSLEKRCFDAKDSLLLIDDFHPTGSPKEGKAMLALAQQVLRAYGDRVGRGRMKQDITLRPDYPPRGMGIVTAEDTLEVGSSAARLFPTELLPGDVDLSKLTEAQRQTRELSEAMYGYLEWIGEAMDSGDTDSLRNLFVERRNLAQQLNVHGRLVEAASWLYLGLSKGLDYAVSVKAIDEARRDELLTEGWKYFLGTAREQGEHVTEMKATAKFITIVGELLANGAIYTVPTKTKDAPPPPSFGTKVGWHDVTYYYFLPEMLYNQVSRFLSAQGEQFPVSPTTLWKQLAEEGLSEPELSKEKGKERLHSLVKRTFEGNGNRKLRVKPELLKEKDETETVVRQRPVARPHVSRVAEAFAPENRGFAP